MLDLGVVVGVAEPGPGGDLTVTLEDATSGDQVAVAWWDDDDGRFAWSIADGAGGEVALDVAPTAVSAISIVFARYHAALVARGEVGYSLASCYWNCVIWTGDPESCYLGCELEN